MLKEFFVLMENKGWILQLPPKANTFHSANFGGENKAKKRRIEASGKENVTPVKNKKIKRSKITTEGNVLKQRHLLKDLVNEVIVID